MYKRQAGYDDFAQRHFWGDPNVKRFSTLVVMNRVKYGLAVPTAQPDEA